MAINCNEEQQQAVTHGEGPLLIVAGAGTGKTKVITERIGYLVLERGVALDRILALTFTEKAAREMEERVDILMPYGYVDNWISTFHSFADKILRRHGLEIGLSTSYRLLDQTETWILVKKNLERFNLDYYRPLGNPTRFIHALIKHFSRCKDEGIGPADYLKYAEDIKLNTDSLDFLRELDSEKLKNKDELINSEILRIEEIANAYHVYEQLLLESDALDFADLITYTIKLFRERPLILEKYRQHFEYILVDEFQDTNFVQNVLIQMLAAPKNNLTVVGDDDQSIYRFRGSSIENIMKFEADYPSAKKVVLTKNYRSSQAILDKAYEFIRQNDPHRLEVSLNINKRLESQIPEAGVVEHLHFDTVEHEAAGVVEKIIELKNNDPESTWSDFAVLVRANDSADYFVKNLASRHIPYQFLALKGLYNKPVILDVINYFKLLDNYHEGSAVYRLLQSPIVNIEHGDIVKIVHFAEKKTLSLFETLREVALVPGLRTESRDAVNKLLANLERDFALIKNSSISKIFLSFMHGSGYYEYLKNLDGAEGYEKLEQLDQFYKKIVEFEAVSEGVDLKSFIELLRMELAAGESGKIPFSVEAGPDFVNVLTVHTSKGLEYKYVFIVNLVDRKFPTDERSEAINIPEGLLRESLPTGDFHIEEERRLFYVAMTRAKRHLYFTSASDYGGARAKKLSRFLLEMGYVSPDNCLSAAKTDTTIAVAELKSTPMKMILPKNFSFSALATYEKCPYQFYLAKILKIPTFGKPALTFGDVIHRTLHDFVSLAQSVGDTTQMALFGSAVKSIIPSFEEFRKLYENNWRDEWYPNKQNKDSYFEKGLKVIKIFYDDYLLTQPRARLLEQPFTLKIQDFKIVGRIDRIDECEDGVEIIDYKTGAVKDDSMRSDEKQQLYLYQLAAESPEVLNLKPKKLTYYYVETGTRVSFLGEDKNKEKLLEKLTNEMSSIAEAKFEPTPSKQICDFCDYRDICEHKKV